MAVDLYKPSNVKPQRSEINNPTRSENSLHLDVQRLMVKKAARPCLLVDDYRRELKGQSQANELLRCSSSYRPYFYEYMVSGLTEAILGLKWLMWETCLEISSQQGVIPTTLSTYIYHFYPIIAMVDWNDPDLEAKLRTLSVQLFYAIFGLYGTASEAASISMAFVRCNIVPFTQALIVKLVTNLAIGCSATNLMIRTWLIWQTSYLLRFFLLLTSLGYWTILTLFVVTTRASTTNGLCMIHFTKPAYASAVVIYTMLYDLVLVVFSVIGLFRMPSPSSTLWKKLVKQGVIYFFLNVLANMILLGRHRPNFVGPDSSEPEFCYEFYVLDACTIASSQVVLSLLRPSPDRESDNSSSAKVAPLTTDFAVSG
ncbi:hypothetical protein BDR06DRAFT_974967 [Suillus hirtellus]|nr:hypothetical protein BDR06DRAFT_974967 [Suillus hirtellus]